MNDLIAQEDEAYMKAVTRLQKDHEALIANAREHAIAIAQPRRWRDGRGIIHALGPVVSVELFTGHKRIESWAPRCGKRRKSTVEHDPTTPITCLTCLVGSTNEEL